MSDPPSFRLRIKLVAQYLTLIFSQLNAHVLQNVLLKGNKSRFWYQNEHSTGVLHCLLIAPWLPIQCSNANNMRRFTNSYDCYLEVIFQLALPRWSSLISQETDRKPNAQLSAQAHAPKRNTDKTLKIATLKRNLATSRNRLVRQRGWHHTRRYMSFSLRFTLKSFLDTFPVPWRSMEVNSFQSASQWRSMFDLSRWWRRCLSLFSLLDRIMKSLSPLLGGETLAFGKAVIKQQINNINT